MIEVKNVSFAYSRQDKAVRNVSFTVNDQEWISIIGHNGSGKSTLSKLLVGLLAADKGTISYDGVNVSEATIDEIRKHVGIVFQNPDNQFVGVNVRYDIAFGLENHCVPRPEMEELISNYAKLVGMSNSLEREPNTLSGGEKQRVAIAGILAMNVDVVILDEATSMLDPEGTRDTIDLIKELKTKYHKTIITITHDLELAKLSDRVLVFKQGEIIGEGVPEELFKNRELLLSSNLDMPFALKMYTEAYQNKNITDRKVVDALWEYHLKK